MTSAGAPRVQLGSELARSRWGASPSDDLGALATGGARRSAFVQPSRLAAPDLLEELVERRVPVEMWPQAFLKTAQDVKVVLDFSA